jgi:hypothetical protein
MWGNIDEMIEMEKMDRDYNDPDNLSESWCGSYKGRFFIIYLFEAKPKIFDDRLSRQCVVELHHETFGVFYKKLDLNPELVRCCEDWKDVIVDSVHKSMVNKIRLIT